MSEIPANSQGLPEADEIIYELMHGKSSYGDPFVDDDDYIAHLDGIAPIQVYYVPTITPSGGAAPENIRAQWLGLQLPVRSKHNDAEPLKGFAVMGREAFQILQKDRPEADEWWRKHFLERAHATYLQTFPTDIAGTNNSNFWIFKPDAGNIQPAEGFLGSLMTHDEMFRTAYAKQHVGQASLRAAQTAEA